MLHKHGLRAALSLEQGLTILFLFTWQGDYWYTVHLQTAADKQAWLLPCPYLSQIVAALRDVVLCRLFANCEREEDTEDEIDEIFAKYKESLKGGIDS